MNYTRSARSQLIENSPYALAWPHIIYCLQSIGLEDVQEDEIRRIWAVIREILTNRSMVSYE